MTAPDPAPKNLTVHPHAELTPELLLRAELQDVDQVSGVVVVRILAATGNVAVRFAGVDVPGLWWARAGLDFIIQEQLNRSRRPDPLG